MLTFSPRVIHSIVFPLILFPSLSSSNTIEVIKCQKWRWVRDIAKRKGNRSHQRLVGLYPIDKKCSRR